MAVKPNRVQSKQLYAFVGGTPTRRVQSFDWSSDFTIDSVFELGNAGLVEDVITLVETNITLNSNEWGTVDLEAQMFDIFEQRNILGDGAVAGVLNTTGSIFVSARGAGGNWVNATVGDYLQIIRFNATSTVNDSEYVLIASKRYVAASFSNVFGIAALTAAPATSDVVTLVNDYTITQDTVDANPVHLVLPHRYSTSATTIMHSVVLPRCFVDSLTYNIDTGGASEQNYTLVGEEERLLLDLYRETQSITGSFASYANATVVFTIPKDSLAAVGSPYVLYAGSNIVHYGDGTDWIDHTSGQVTVSARIGTGLGLDANTQLVYYFANVTKVGYKGLTNIDSGIGKLSKGYVKIDLQFGSGDVETLQRCTGIAINIPLTRESIDELGTSTSIAKPLEGNLRNEITLTFNRNDLREYAKLLGSQAAFDAGTLNEILMTDLKSSKTNTIRARFYNSQTAFATAANLLKTITFSACNFIGDNSTTPISGASGLELNFSSETVNIVGNGLPPIYV